MNNFPFAFVKKPKITLRIPWKHPDKMKFPGSYLENMKPEVNQ